MANRLQSESSPYLLQHADNPVDWRPWGPEALQAAKDEDKPIFLSIGYAACHWCHVMAHESFEDEATATIMNEHFINIKVDREERPDVDSLYMDAVVSMTGQGGWPMSVFLAPDGKPFYGGTYFPPEARHSMPSFREVLLSIANTWKEDRERVESAGSQLAERIAQTPSLQPSTEHLDPSALVRATEGLFKSYDWKHGGWGGAPKFPQPMAIEFLFRRFERENEKLALEMGLHALTHMANGGIYDHLAGGFARYSVDDRWLVPHFEKMLYDNAQLILIYLHGWQLSGDEHYLQVVHETIDFLEREMRDPAGGFYSSLDADSEGEEGKFYVWKPNEIHELLGADSADLMRVAYGVTDEGNFEGSSILHQAVSLSDLAKETGRTESDLKKQLEASRIKLLEARGRRIRPGTDDKVLTAWNGLTLVSLAEVAHATQNDKALGLAQDLAGFLLDNMIVKDRLKRSWRQGQARYDAYLEDHAALGEGLLALYQVDFNPRWFNSALTMGETILDHFSDPLGGFFDTRDDHELLIARPKSVQDSPIPSGNSLACTLLLKLGALTGDRHFYEPANSALRAFQDTAARHPAAFAGWLNALDYELGPHLELALIGDPQSESFQELSGVTAGGYFPRLVRAGGLSTDGGPMLLADRPLLDGTATAYLCEGFTCKLPTTSAEELGNQINEVFRTSK
jgi:uncharacterized protein YyaL (SSP411 family)